MRKKMLTSYFLHGFLVFLCFMKMSSPAKGQFCGKRLTGGRWTSYGNCNGTKMKDLRTNLKALAKAEELKKLRAAGLCGVMYLENCFFVKVKGVGSTDQNAADRLCNESGASLADIHSLKQFEDLAEYVRNLITSSYFGSHESAGFKTGMTYDSQNGTIYLSDGKKAPFSRWKALYKMPPPSSRNKYITMVVHKAEKKSRDGFDVRNFTMENHGPLCQLPAYGSLN